MAATTSSGPRDLLEGGPETAILRELARRKLVSILQTVPGSKDLVIDEDLMKPLDRIAGASLFKDNGCEKIFKLGSSSAQSPRDQRVYVVRPEVVKFKYIADHINADVRLGRKKQYTVLATPRKLAVCDWLLEQEGVYDLVTIMPFPLDLIPLDKDVLSLEMPAFFRSVFLEGDQTCLHAAARSLVTLQHVYGVIPSFFGQGRCAKMVYDMMNLIFEEEGTPKLKESLIGQVILVDRDLDYITPLCSSLTYEGLLDETFSIKSGFVDFGPEVTGKDGHVVKLLLSSHDEVFQEIRNQHFSHIFNYLRNRARDLQRGYNKRHNLASVRDMKDFVARDLGALRAQHKSLTLHMGASEVIVTRKTKGDFGEHLSAEHSLLDGSSQKDCISYIEESINRQYNIWQTLRLICLLSLTHDGLPTKDFRLLKTQFLQSHGYERALLLHNLKRLGLFVEQEGSVSTPFPRRNIYRTLARKLQLVPKSDDIQLENPTDVSYVLGGAFCPLLCKFVEQILSKGGFSNMDDVCKLLPGTPFSSRKSVDSSSNNVVLVYFLGGVTHTEIAALRFLEKLKGFRFLVATTAIINGSTLLQSVSQ